MMNYLLFILKNYFTIILLLIYFFSFTYDKISLDKLIKYIYVPIYKFISLIYMKVIFIFVK